MTVAFEVREGRIYSRACDDLIGCTAIVAMLRELSASGAEAACYGLFTRAEEVGFVESLELGHRSLQDGGAGAGRDDLGDAVGLAGREVGERQP